MGEKKEKKKDKKEKKDKEKKEKKEEKATVRSAPDGSDNYYFTLAGLYGPQSILLKFQQIFTDLPNDLTWVLDKHERICKKRKSSKFNA